MDAALGAAGNFSGDLADEVGCLGIIAENLVHLVGEEVAGGSLDEAGFLENAAGGGVVGAALVDLVPLLQQHGEIADEVAGAGAGSNGAHDDAHALGDGELLDDAAQALAFLRILDLAGNTELLGERHQHEVAASQRDIGGHARALGADRSLGNLDDDLGADGVNARDVF